jgi:hypothetical protein
MKGPSWAYGPIADFDNSEIFTMKNEHSYAAFMGVISNMCMKAHASSFLRTKPYKAVLVIDQSMTRPYNNQPESSLERLISIVKQIKRPRGGIEISIYVAECDMFYIHGKVGLKHTVSHMWPLKCQSTNEIITINFPPRKLYSGENKVRYFDARDLGKKTISKIQQNIDYNWTIKDVFSILSRSKLHISYQGGTSWLSICMGIPTIIVHPNVEHIYDESLHNHHQKFKIFGQELGNVNYVDAYGKIRHDRQLVNEIHTTPKRLRSLIEEYESNE